MLRRILLPVAALAMVSLSPGSAAVSRFSEPVPHHVSLDASHVLKHELKSIPDLLADRAAVQATHSADGIPIDADVVAVLTAWIRGKS